LRNPIGETSTVADFRVRPLFFIACLNSFLGDFCVCAAGMGGTAAAAWRHSAEVMGARLFTTTTTAGINRALAAHPLTCIGYVTACRYAVFTPVVFSIRQLGVPVPAELAMA
jgi:hypothetical protein